MALSRTMKYYKSPKGRAAYKRKLKKDVERSTSPEGLKKRAELKRIRRSAKKRGLKIKGKDYDHASKRFVSPSKNRGRKSGTVGDKNARG